MLARRAVLAGLAATLARPAAALPDPADARIRRRYLDGPFGQLHVRVASPADRPAEPPLVLLHQSPLSGRMFDKLLPHLADRRLAIAVDTPGYGESDRPRERPTLDGYGDAILTALGAGFGSRLDLLGYHTGAGLAANMAARRPDRVRKLVLLSVPYFDTARRTALRQDLGRETVTHDDGSHLLPLWTSTFKVRPAGQSLDDVARIVAEKQRVGAHGGWALQSVIEADLEPLLRRIAQPTLVMTPHDGLEDESLAAAKLIAAATRLDLPDHAYGLFDAAPAAIARDVLAFLG